MVREPIQIRFSDFDSFRHVNNAVYSTYFEIGRVAWMRDILGLGAGSNLAGIPFILARIEMDMLKPIDYAMEAEVITLVSRIGNSSWDFSAFLVSPGDKDIYARAKTVQVCYDYEAAATAQITGSLREKLEQQLTTDVSFVRRFESSTGK